MAEPMQNWSQPGQGYRPVPPIMQRPPYPGAQQQSRPTNVPFVSALTREERQEAKRLAEEASFSFEGYQVVRREFISHRYDPAMTVRGDSITFNNSCITKLESATYIQFLINPIERKLAIRPCDEGARDAVRWCVVRGDKRKSREIKCRPFTEKLYELMGWDPRYRYKLQGMRIIHNGETLYLFDLSAKEAFLPQSRDPQTGKRRSSKAILPPEWNGNFGMDVKAHTDSTRIDLSEGFVAPEVTEEQNPAQEETIKQAVQPNAVTEAAEVIV